MLDAVVSLFADNAANVLTTTTATALNVANRHLLIDNSLTFGGFHYNDPREIFVELRWRFHY